MKLSTAKTLALSALVLATGAVSAADENANKCETDKSFGAFDFWVGDWSVKAAKSGKYAGTNKVTKIENGCAIKEDWAGTGGSTGQSLNYYDPNTQRWRQVWVSGGAYAIDIEGGLQNGSMVLEGMISYFKNGVKAPFRGTWTPGEDGSVRQFFEQFDSKSESWKPWFDGIYTPADNPR